MPRTPSDKYRKKQMPEIDMAWAIVLVRQRQLDLSLKDLAERAGLNYDHTRKVMSMGSPTIWPEESRNKILAALGLRARLVIEDAEEDRA